jgi:hypothetical protein
MSAPTPRGAKTFQHPVVGRLDLAFEVMQLPAEPGLTLIAYTAQPGTPAHDNLALLNAWAATPQQDAGVPDQSPAAAQRPRTGDNGTA